LAPKQFADGVQQPCNNLESLVKVGSGGHVNSHRSLMEMYSYIPWIAIVLIDISMNDPTTGGVKAIILIE
jgi:hypothetical protein